MKLKKVDRDKWQKCCRWCHYYQNGKCYNSDHVEHSGDFNIYSVSENGLVDLALREVLDGHRTEFRDLEYKLREWNISEKRIREFNDLFGNVFEKYVNRIVPELDEAVAVVYQKQYEEPNNFNGVYIKDPENYCCKDWC